MLSIYGLWLGVWGSGLGSWGVGLVEGVGVGVSVLGFDFSYFPWYCRFRVWGLPDSMLDV